MTEFSSRVDAQRQILRVVNEKYPQNEQLFALSAKAIQRWTSANHVDTSTRLVKLLASASAEIFTMANHSDDPIAGTYTITKARVLEIKDQISNELDGDSLQISISSARESRK